MVQHTRAHKSHWYSDGIFFMSAMREEVWKLSGRADAAIR